MAKLQLTIGGDGYSQSFSFEAASYVCLEVWEADDSITWKLQGTLDDGRTWYDLEDDEGNLTRTCQTRPKKFDVDYYTSGRISTSKSDGTFTGYIKHLLV